MDKKYFTTSEVAKLLSVAPDTVLKWVKAGKIASYRTPGGHSRIPVEAVEDMLPKERFLKKTEETNTDSKESFQYCWEFFSKSGELGKNCHKCIAYRSHSHRCFEMKHIPKQFGHLKMYCKDSCDECEYYLLTHFENKI